jgi:hypothetical protein
MRRSRGWSAAACTTALLAPFTFANGADAKVLESGSETFSFDETVTDFCDVEGLDIQSTGTFTLRYRLVSRGTEQLPYFLQTSSSSRTFTNPDTDLSVTVFDTVLDKDMTVTDNGDDTFTILVLGTGAAWIKDQNGRIIGANPGQIRYEILIDNAGTPSDPTDDEFIEDLGVVFGSTGRNDDFCEVVVPALT